MKVIFFGAGSFARKVWKQINASSEYYYDEYIAFADNNKDLWGQHFEGKRVIAPSEIADCLPDLVVITSNLYEGAIRKQLIRDLNIPEEKIYTYGEYLRLCYAGNAYRKKYGCIGQNKSSYCFEKKSIVVYTAITGDYDSLKEPESKPDNLTYVCITNNPNMKSRTWNIEYVKDKYMDNVHLARHIKLNPHLYFKDYDISVWVDGKYQITDDLRTYIAQYQKDSNILCFPHPERNCICDEVAACILWTNGINRDMIIQVADYLKDGYPINYGLYDTGCLVRTHNDALVKYLMCRWENEIDKYSFRDQLSFPYICWKNKFEPDICNLDINHNQWLLQKRNLY